MMRRWGLVLTTLLAAGCASPWEQHFARDADTPAVIRAVGGPVEIRVVEPDAMDQAVAESDVIGWSEFTATKPFDPAGDERLQEFARKIGADRVVASREYGGRFKRRVQRPAAYSPGGPLVVRQGKNAGTRVVRVPPPPVFVPEEIVEDRYVYTAAFLRRRGSQ